MVSVDACVMVDLGVTETSANFCSLVCGGDKGTHHVLMRRWEIMKEGMEEWLSEDHTYVIYVYTYTYIYIYI